MAEPITITIFAVDDPERSDHLIVSVDRDLVLLSVEDLDEVRWVSTRGIASIDFAPANNPFDPNAFTGGEYILSEGGSSISGPPAEIVVQGEDTTVFREFKYSITVTDDDRSGSLDPHIRIRGDSVYD